MKELDNGIKTINEEDFIPAIREHWETVLGNVSNPQLERAWLQIVETFNHHIKYHDNPYKAKEWSCLSPPTGSGKTQSLILFASMLSKLTDSEHPAILIITQRKVDCDEIVKKINEYGVRDTAIAYHGDTKGSIKLTALCTHPVVVITHSGYKKALEYLGHENWKTPTWSRFVSYDREGQMIQGLQGQRNDVMLSSRRLIVIDESFEICNHYMTTLRNLKSLKSLLPVRSQIEFAQEIDYVNDIIIVLEDLERNSYSYKQRRQIVRDHLMVKLKHPDSLNRELNFSGLISVIKGICGLDQLFGVSDPDLSKNIKDQLEQDLRSVEAVSKSWFYFMLGQADTNSFNTAELIVPENIKGCVVLDATAKYNLIYQLYSEANIIDPPKGVRSYRNVNLNVSMGHRVGKVYMTDRDNADVNSQKLYQSLNDVLSEDDQVLIVCHKGIEDHINSYKGSAKFTPFIEHWGNLDGSNEFRECNVVVIYGLNYRNKSWSPNVYFATQGMPHSEDWFWNKKSRRYKNIEDIRQALDWTIVSVDAVQAINRVRCRKVIDDQGNCPETEVFILLPSGKEGMTELNLIKSAMPDVKVNLEFAYGHLKRKLRRSNHEGAICTMLKNAKKGKYYKNHICKRFSMTSMTFERLMSNALQNKESLLSQTMSQYRITYHAGTGRYDQAFFMKVGKK